MGEYVKYKGRSIKIGTCEDLFYTDYRRYSKALREGLLAEDKGSAHPEVYVQPKSGSRFRFPFPDEDELPLGDVGTDEFERGLLITIERCEYFPKHWFPALNRNYTVTSRYQSELKRELPMVNPNNVFDTIDIEIVQQKLVYVKNELLLVLVYRCPYSGERWRIDDLSVVMHITTQIEKYYTDTTEDRERKAFWAVVIERILSGYAPQNRNEPSK